MTPEPSATVPVVDVNIPRFNQAAVALLTGAAFAADQQGLVVFAAALMALSAFTPIAPLTWLYTRSLRPRLQPSGPVDFEPAAPPRFSQRIGATVLAVASVAFVVGLPAVGWTLTLLVTALATLAAAARICVGCILYERVVRR